MKMICMPEKPLKSESCFVHIGIQELKADTIHDSAGFFNLNIYCIRLHFNRDKKKAKFTTTDVGGCAVEYL